MYFFINYKINKETLTSFPEESAMTEKRKSKTTFILN